MVIEKAEYRILNVMELPSKLADSLCSSLEMANDSGRIVNPKYHPDLAEWLRENGEDPGEVFIAWVAY